MARNKTTAKPFASPMTISGKRFKGKLLEPIEIPTLPLREHIPAEALEVFDRVFAAAMDSANSQLAERVAALAEHYGVENPYALEDPTPAFALLLRTLAADFIQGFAVNHHRKTKSGKFAKAAFTEVNARVKKAGETVKKACAHVSRHSSNKELKNRGPANIEAAFYETASKSKQALHFLQEHEHYGPLIEALGFPAFHEALAKKFGKDTKLSD